MYTINDIAYFCGVNYGTISRIVKFHNLKSTPLYGDKYLKRAYTFHQIFIIQKSLQQASNKEISFDLKKEEVFIIYQSKVNLE